MENRSFLCVIFLESRPSRTKKCSICRLSTQTIFFQLQTFRQALGHRWEVAFNSQKLLKFERVRLYQLLPGSDPRGGGLGERPPPPNGKIPPLDCVCVDLKTRFSTEVLDAFKLPLLLPESVVKLSNFELDETVQCILNRFSSLLGCNMILETMKLKGEVSLWQQKWKSEATSFDGTRAIDVLNGCDKDIYPTIHTLFQVLCTMPVSNASAERSFSSLQRLKSWTRSTMVQKRLVGLALLHIHHDIIVDPNNIINRFAKSKTHRLCL